MHTMRFGDYVFHYNSDLSGYVTIHRLDRSREGTEMQQIAEEFEVPGVLLAGFVAEIQRSEQISRLEQAPVLNLLGLEHLQADLDRLSP